MTRGLRLSEAELTAMQNRAKAPAPSKLYNQPQIVDNIRFDSKLEAKRYGELKLLEKAGAIYELHVHPRYRIDVNGMHVCDFVPDFDYIETKTHILVIEDAKGRQEGDRWAMFQLKRKLLKATMGLDVVVIDK